MKLGDVLKRYFTREAGLYITSEEHSIPESYEKDWSRDLDSVLDCEITFSGTDCLIHVTVFDNVLEDNEE